MNDIRKVTENVIIKYSNELLPYETYRRQRGEAGKYSGSCHRSVFIWFILQVMIWFQFLAKAGITVLTILL